MKQTMSLVLAVAATAGSALAAPAPGAMTLKSADILPGATIAAAQVYPRCGGENISPALSWSGTPAGARSLVLTMIDEDVKPAMWSHWIVIDLPPTASSLPRGAKTLPAPAKAVAGNFGEAAYAGPCPPKGSGAHHYRFTIWAMPTPTTSLAANAKASAVAADLAMRAIGNASFVGIVER